jgi:hypothetical protein
MRQIFAGFAIALVVSIPAAAQKEPMTPVDLLEVPVLSDPRLSPDGEKILFVLAEADWKANERVPAAAVGRALPGAQGERGGNAALLGAP